MAFVIDLDDTLIDAKRTRIEAFAAIDRLAVERFRVKPRAVVDHADSVLESLWRSSPFVEEFIRLGCAATDALWVDFSGPGPLLAEIRRWMPEFRERFWAALAGRAGTRSASAPSVLGDAFVTERRARIRTFHGVAGVLAGLNSRFPLALLTNGPSDLQRLKLKTTGLEPYFDAVIVSAEAGVAKPRAEAFALACDTIGSPARHTVMIGDDWELDMMGALRAGLSAVRVRTGSPQKSTSGQAAAARRIPVLDRFTDLPLFLLARCLPQ